MSTAVPIKFVVGSRAVLTVPKHLETIGFSISDLLDAAMPDFPALTEEADGYRILSAPADKIEGILAKAPGFVTGGVQSYCRYYIDMSGDYEGYLARFSSKTRSTLRRKQRKLAKESGGTMDVREYRSPAEVAEFLDIALPLSAKTYQARTLDAGLPEGNEARHAMIELAAQDRVRAYLLFFGGEAISYLYLPIEGDTVRYAYLGYDQSHARLSPGTVLQMEALERLFAEGAYRYFDFTEGEGAHKAMFGTDYFQCCSLVLLRPTLVNRTLLGSLALFDTGIASAKSLMTKLGAQAALRRILRQT